MGADKSLKTGYKDIHGRDVCLGHKVECAFYGMGGWWYDYFTVEFGAYNGGRVGFHLVDTHGKKHGLDHPKFQCQREIVSS